MDLQDLQDLQDDRRSDLQFGETTEKIIGGAFEVIPELGTGFLESVDENALAIALQDKGLRVQCQHPMPVHESLASSMLTFSLKEMSSSSSRLPRRSLPSTRPRLLTT